MRLDNPGLWTGITAAGCVSLVLCQLGGLTAAAAASKIAASAGFIGVALSSGALRSRYGRILFAGLVLSAFGDMFLLGPTGRWFLLGLVSFLLAHLAYIGAFVTVGFSYRWVLLAAGPMAVASLLVSVWLTPHVGSDMLLPVRVYTLVISVMVIAAFGARGVGGSILIPVGAVLFYLSDLSVAAGRFVQPEFPNYVWGLPLYYTGQVCLALSAEAALRQLRQWSGRTAE